MEIIFVAKNISVSNSHQMLQVCFPFLKSQTLPNLFVRLLLLSWVVTMSASPALVVVLSE